MSDDKFQTLRRHFPNPEELVEVHMAAALPNISNRVNNPFRTDLEEEIKPFKP